MVFSVRIAVLEFRLDIKYAICFEILDGGFCEDDKGFVGYRNLKKIVGFICCQMS